MNCFSLVDFFIGLETHCCDDSIRTYGPKGAVTRKLSYRSPPTGSRISWFREAVGFRKTKCPNGGTVPDFGSNFRILDFEICHISRILDLGANLRKLQRGEYMKNTISANWQFREIPTHRLVPEKKCYGN